jgi:hypothetical protein
MADSSDALDWAWRIGAGVAGAVSAALSLAWMGGSRAARLEARLAAQDARLAAIEAAARRQAEIYERLGQAFSEQARRDAAVNAAQTARIDELERQAHG